MRFAHIARLLSAALLSAPLLSACASVVPTTAARLAALDPLTAGPAAISVAVILPPGLSVTPGSAVLEFGATRGGEHLKGSFALEDSSAAAGIPVPDGATAKVYALTDADAAQMRALQAEIAVWKQTGNAKGSLGLGLGGCALGNGPAPDAEGSVYIRLADSAPFLPLIAGERLDVLLGADVLAAIQPCKGAG